jgi:hypothetical protein
MEANMSSHSSPELSTKAVRPLAIRRGSGETVLAGTDLIEKEKQGDQKEGKTQPEARAAVA